MNRINQLIYNHSTCNGAFKQECAVYVVGAKAPALLTTASFIYYLPLLDLVIVKDIQMSMYFNYKSL